MESIKGASSSGENSDKLSPEFQSLADLSEKEFNPEAVQNFTEREQPMKRLFTIDLKDYNPNGEKFYRPSVRGIIVNDDGDIAMIYSQKYHFYKFPGGGIEGNETHLETLAREIKEETGMTLIPESAKEFGEVLKIQNGNESGKDTIHIQQNFYYTCRVEDGIGDQDLDDGEKDLDFVLKFVPIDEAIKTNSAFESDDSFKKQMAEREKRVLEILKDTQS